MSLTCAVFAEETQRTAKIDQLAGDVSVKLYGKEGWASAKKGMTLTEGDMLKTGMDSFAFLRLNGGGETAYVEVSENSKLLLSELIADKEKGTQRTLLDLAIGQILIKAEKIHTPESKFEVKTPTSIVGVRGTRFSVKVEAIE